ncbi:MAG: Asp23/Gls24 family envelope stress response protein [Clostridiales bacterium]|nr:Asp23/Gls24 family envelope stress response protein [Clostridiales bacterium]
MPLKSRYNANFTGDVTYGRNLVSSIIVLAVQEINGVASLQGKGIRTEMNGNTVNVDVFVNVEFGVSCSDVAFRVQENVKRSVETMSKYKVGVVNVNILGINMADRDDKTSM